MIIIITSLYEPKIKFGINGYALRTKVHLLSQTTIPWPWPCIIIYLAGNKTLNIITQNSVHELTHLTHIFAGNN